MSDEIEGTKIGWKIPATSSSSSHQHRPSHSSSESPNKDNYLLNIGKYLLKDIVFYGHYQEKRLVGHLGLYRDLIVVSNTETELKKKLEELRRIYIDQKSTEQIWFGVTDPKTIGAPVGYCIWTEIDGVPFGEYWFRIKRILFKDKEIVIKLKCLRQYDKNDKKEIPQAKEPEPWSNVQYDPKEVAKSFKELLTMWKIAINEFILSFCSVRLTFSNLINVLQYFGLILVSLIAIIVQFIQYFGEYSIKFMEQFNNLIKVLTPFMMGVLVLISKIIGGFYMLIAMIWKDSVVLRSRRRQMEAIDLSRNDYVPRLMIQDSVNNQRNRNRNF